MKLQALASNLPFAFWYLCCDNQEVIVQAALHALLHWVPEAERRAGSSHLARAVNVAELVELDLIFGQVVIWWDESRVDFGIMSA